ncbi:hypothetical protein LguiB_020404 [Lonicera macranthoides]
MVHLRTLNPYCHTSQLLPRFYIKTWLYQLEKVSTGNWFCRTCSTNFEYPSMSPTPILCCIQPLASIQ